MSMIQVQYPEYLQTPDPMVWQWVDRGRAIEWASQGTTDAATVVFAPQLRQILGCLNDRLVNPPSLTLLLFVIDAIYHRVDPVMVAARLRRLLWKGVWTEDKIRASTDWLLNLSNATEGRQGSPDAIADAVAYVLSAAGSNAPADSIAAWDILSYLDHADGSADPTNLPPNPAVQTRQLQTFRHAMERAILVPVSEQWVDRFVRTGVVGEPVPIEDLSPDDEPTAWPID